MVQQNLEASPFSFSGLGRKPLWPSCPCPSRPKQTMSPLFFVLINRPAASHVLCSSIDHATHPIHPCTTARPLESEVNEESSGRINQGNGKFDFNQETIESLILCTTKAGQNPTCIRASPSPYKLDLTGHL
jgi:hypothetical protein